MRDEARRNCLRGMAAGLLGLFIVLLAALPASAQLPIATGGNGSEATNEPGPNLQQMLDQMPKPLSTDQVDAILAVLDDTQAREALRESVLRQVAEGQQAASDETLLEQHKRRVADIGQAFRELPASLSTALYAPSANGRPGNPIRLALILGGHILIGAIAMLATRRALRNAFQSLISHESTGVGQSIARCGGLIVIDLLEIGAFCLAVALLFVVVAPSGDPRAPLILEALLIACAGTLLAAKFSNAVLTPGIPSFRLVPLSDRAAARLHWIVVLVFGSLLALNFIVKLLAILGLPRDAQVVTGMLLGGAFCAMLVVFIWTNRAAVAVALARTFGDGPYAVQVAGLWPIAGTAYVVGLWFVATDAEIRGNEDVTPQAMASLIIVVLVPVLGYFAGRVLQRFFAEAPRPAAVAAAGGGEGGEAPEPLQSRTVDLSKLMRGVWIILVIIAISLTARLWGFDPTTQTGASAAAFRVVFESTFIILASYIGWQLFRTAVDRKLAEASREDASAQSKRLATLLPLMQKFIMVVLLVMIALIVLSSMGIEIGPLLAGAGVIGLAIGLGAQSLVTDIVAGVFFLIDDAFSVGDYIEVGSLRGTVESISIRSLKLRHHRGAVHTLPFGQMQSLTNYSRDWVIMKLEFRVPHDTDIALVKKLVKRIGAEMLEDPIYGGDFLEPLKSQGVRRIEDNALIIGVKFMSKPGTQFVIRKDAYQRIRDAFEANDIEFANRGVTVRVETGAEADSAVAGAAAEAIADAVGDQVEANPAE